MLAEASCIRRSIAAACGLLLSAGGSGESCPVEGLVLTVAACIDSMQAFRDALHESLVEGAIVERRIYDMRTIRFA